MVFCSLLQQTPAGLDPGLYPPKEDELTAQELGGWSNADLLYPFLLAPSALSSSVFSFILTIRETDDFFQKMQSATDSSLLPSPIPLAQSYLPSLLPEETML